VHAQQLIRENPNDASPARLADLFCRHAKRRVARSFDDVFDNDDGLTYRVAQETLAGEFAWLEKGLPV
jgi:hypothetical protein